VNYDVMTADQGVPVDGSSAGGLAAGGLFGEEAGGVDRRRYESRG